MKKLFISVLMLISLGLLSGIVIAQDDEMTTFEFETSDATLMHPEDWEQEVDEDGVVTLTTEGITVMVYDAPTIAELFDVEDVESAEDVLASVVDGMEMDDVELDVNDAKAVELDEREVLRLAFETDDDVGAVIVVPMADESFSLVVYRVASDAADELSSLVDDVVASFDIGEASEASGGEVCTLSTTSSDTVQIRVGPGFNRTVIAFLPANVDFEAQGQTTDDDGNVWFRVPEDQAAPTKAVNETWIAGDDVDQSGDCAGVVDALAPPIIPITQQQPVAPATSNDATTTDTTTTTETTTDAPAGDAFATDASGAFILSQGTWVELRGVGNIRCNSFSTDAGPAQGTVIDTLSGGGSAGINFGGLFYAYIGNNTYETTYTQSVDGGDILVRETITMTSANTGTGSIGGVSGPCTLFLPLTINYSGG